MNTLNNDKNLNVIEEALKALVTTIVKMHLAAKSEKTVEVNKTSTLNDQPSNKNKGEA